MKDLVEVPDSASLEVLAARRAFPHERVLARIAGDVRALFPDRVERLVLFGSRARGDVVDRGGYDDSDWDVGVFLRDGPTKDDREALSKWSMDMLYETWHAISPLVFPQGAYDRRTIFMFGLRQDAIDL